MITNKELKLADNIVNYSCELKKGEKILIESSSKCRNLINAIIKKTYEVGGIPFVKLEDEIIKRELLKNCNLEQMEKITEYESNVMKDMDAYVSIRSIDNAYELSDVDISKMKIYNETVIQKVHFDIRCNKTKWVILRYPNSSAAQKCNMSTEAFEKFYYDVCTVDYKKMSNAMQSLVDLMNKTDNVRIVTKDTNLTFSIKDINSVKCDGKCNVPDGEVFTAPIKDSVNGYITYNTPSIYQGFKFQNIRLEFKDGKIIKATSNDDKRLNEILDMDEGARYIGEFAFGLNPHVNNAICDTLFDEKIAGSIHFTPGDSYKDAFNGNISKIHWDLVLIQTPEYGGGEIYFDDVLIRKDGEFVLEKLKKLNKDNLI